jgi:hypothetical protein
LGIWQKRYFMTHGHYLLYFADKSKIKTLAAMDLLRVKIHTPTQAAIQVKFLFEGTGHRRLTSSSRAIDMARSRHVFSGGDHSRCEGRQQN